MTQLAAQGQQSSAVTGMDYTPFKTVVRRVTAFSTEPKVVQFNGTTDFNKVAQCHIPRTADLLSKIWLVIETDPISETTHSTSGVKHYKAVEDVARAMIEYITLEAGSITYQTIYPEWLVIREELSTTSEKIDLDLTGKPDRTTGTSQASRFRDLPYKKNRFYVQIPFWFSRTYGHALPIVNLHLTEITIKIKMKGKTDVIISNGGLGTGEYSTGTAPNKQAGQPAALSSSDFAINQMYLLGEYIYLSDNERTSFATNQHAYLIEQVQTHTETIAQGATSHVAKLQFNHPCKAFYWYGIKKANKEAKNWLDWSGFEDGLTGFAKENSLFDTAKISLNNNTRVMALGPKYYGVIQPQQHHTRIPTCNVYMYSFALAPENVQPSGNLNCSRIETISLELKFGTALGSTIDLTVIAENYNIVRIGNGISMLSWAS